MTSQLHLIDALQLENAALRTQVAELLQLLSAAQDACDKAEAARQQSGQRRADQEAEDYL